MGRRPNPLVLQYFYRGDKREDGSNRYRFTCKGCGEAFPKGRNEYMICHLTDRCKALSDEQKAVIAAFVLEPKAVVANGGGWSQPRSRLRSEREGVEIFDVDGDAGDSVYVIDAAEEEEMEMEQRQRHRLTGLEALAEASRRVGSAGQVGDDNVVIDPTLQDYETVIRSQLGEFLRGGLLQASAAEAYGMSDTTAASSGYLPETAASSAERLTSIATSATSTLEESLRWPGSAGMANPVLSPSLLQRASSEQDERQLNGTNGTSTNQALVRRTVSSWPATTGNEKIGTRAATFPPQSASPGHRKAPLRTNSGSSENGNRVQKNRSRLSASRRKEVSDVRKKGACVRCRMLRKMCSDGDPCSSCVNVDARIWKTPCIRIRLSQAFQLYADDPFEGLALKTIGAIEGAYHLQDSVVEVSLEYGRDSHLAIKFQTRVAVPRSTPSDGREVSLDDCKYAILASEMEEQLLRVLKKLLADSAKEMHQREPNEVIRCSLKEAESLVARAKEDTLLNEALYLWDLTSFLTSDPSEWTVTAGPGVFYQPPTSNPEGPVSSATTVTDPCRLTPSQSSIIFIQLHSLVSKRASACFKLLVNELEHILSRLPASLNRFGVFLAAVCLLSSIEKLEAWMRQFEDDKSMRMARGHDSKDTKNEWPLPIPVQEYIHSARSFCTLIATLVKLRGIPPRTTRAEDGSGILVAAPQWPNPRRPSINGGSPTDGPTVDEDAKRWFEAVRVTRGYLEVRRDVDAPRQPIETVATNGDSGDGGSRQFQRQQQQEGGLFDPTSGSRDEFLQAPQAQADDDRSNNNMNGHVQSSHNVTTTNGTTTANGNGSLPLPDAATQQLLQQYLQHQENGPNPILRAMELKHVSKLLL